MGYVFVLNHNHHNMTSQYNHRYAPPITREGFSCSGPSDEDFYISLPSDPTSRYSRADSSYLYFLLTYTEPLRPILSSSGTVAKIQPPPHKDKSQGFYCAQLMHYGRKALKTKAAAKKELLAAFGEEGSLRVPERIERLKREMLKEYVELNERALEVEAERKEAEGNGNGKGQRKVVAKRKLVTRQDASDEARTSVSAPPKRRNRATVETFTTGSVPFSQTPGAGNVGATSNDEVRTVSRSNVTLPPTQSTPYDIHGQYDIVSPFLSTSTDLSDDLPSLSLQISSSLGPSHHIWVSFTFGSTSGIMRSIGSCPPFIANTSNPSTSTAATFTVTFTWRGTSTLPNGSQHLSFGSDHVARITFLGLERNSTAATHDRVLKGSISGGRLGRNIEFMGTRLKGVQRQMANLHIGDVDVSAWKRQYRAINAKTQQMLLAVKWGQHSASAGSSNIFEGSDEGPAGSDTSYPGNEPHRGGVDEDEDYNMIEDDD